MNLEEVFNFYKGKKVLVTGHTGFKGTWLSRILVNAGAEVTGYSLNPPTDPALFNMAGFEGKMNSVIGDIRDLAHLKQVFEDTKRDERHWHRQYFGVCPPESVREVLLKRDDG